MKALFSMTIKILLVEDDRADVTLFTRALDAKYSVHSVTHLASAVSLLTGDEGNYDVVVADLGLPDAKGLDVLRALRDTNSPIPIVAITGLHNENLAVEAIKLGIQDYMNKDRGGYEQLRRVITHAIARKQAQSELLHLALHDPLTGVGSRSLFDERLEQALRRARRRRDRLGLMYLDLDDFKVINDTRGHGAGDDVLRQVAARIRDSVRDTDTIVRMGGDEFTVIAEALGENDHAHRLLQTLVATLGEPFWVDDEQLSISASIGVAFFPEDGETKDVLTKSADSAMYAAKHRGGNCWQRYQASTTADSEAVQTQSTLG